MPAGSSSSALGRCFSWVKDNRQAAAGGAAIVVLLVSSIWLTAHQGEVHMRHISDLIHKYDARSCENMMAEQSQEHGKSMQEKDLEISALRARAVHFENESTQTKVRLAQLEKQLVAAQHDGTTWQKEAARFSSDLKKSVELQNELVARMKANEEAYKNAQNLEKMFETVRSEYDATSKVLQQVQDAANVQAPPGET